MKIMLHNLPPTIERAWGSEVATEFVSWLQNQLQDAQQTPEISAFIARQKVNVLMLERVSNLLLANEPTLIQTAPSHWVWRVPIDMTLPKQGRIGLVGSVDVNTMSGEIVYDQQLLEQFEQAAEQLYITAQ